MRFIVTSLDTAVAEEIRNAESDAYGNELRAEAQTAPGNPCRHCLRRAKEGERLVLFSYSPFEARNPYKEVGPIFVHAGGCARYARNDSVPEDFLNRPIVLRGYDAQQRIARVAVVVDGSTEQRIEELLADPGVAFVHARSFTHGCFLFRVDRPGVKPGAGAKPVGPCIRQNPPKQRKTAPARRAPTNPKRIRRSAG